MDIFIYMHLCGQDRTSRFYGAEKWRKTALATNALACQNRVNARVRGATLAVMVCDAECVEEAGDSVLVEEEVLAIGEA